MNREITIAQAIAEKVAYNLREKTSENVNCDICIQTTGDMIELKVIALSDSGDKEWYYTLFGKGYSLLEAVSDLDKQYYEWLKLLEA